jgi:hypothetical protein
MGDVSRSPLGWQHCSGRVDAEYGAPAAAHANGTTEAGGTDARAHTQRR